VLRSSKSLQSAEARSFKFNVNGSMVDLRCADTFHGRTLPEEDPELVVLHHGQVAAVEPTSRFIQGQRSLGKILICRSFLI